MDLTPALGARFVPRGSVLAIGVDVAWWGGSAKSESAQTETIASAVRKGGRWRDFGFQRIQLTPTPEAARDRFTANADPRAEDLARAITARAGAERDVAHVVVGLDAPLLARPRPSLPRRSRETMKPGSCADRACEVAFRANVKPSPKGWRSVNIQPGAPLFPRIEHLVAALGTQRFRVYEGPAKALPTRVLVECFPNDALWSAGVLGTRFAGFSFRDVASYKKLGRVARVWPASVLRAMTDFYVRPVAEIAGLDAKTTDTLLDRMWRFFASDAHLTGSARGAGGARGAIVVSKALDDALDSTLTLLCAIALADGRAHVHLGDDPRDGHVVGPGLPRHG